MFGLDPHERYTYEHYRLLPEGDRRELIEGQLLVTPAPSEKHQRLISRLAAQLFPFLSNNPCGQLYFSPFDVILDDNNVVQPDIVFVLNENKTCLHADGLRGAPDLVVEVHSPSTRSRDLIYKRKLYYQFGVRELWFVDPEADSLTLLVRGATDFQDGMNSSLLPGFAPDLEKLFSPL